MMPSTLCRFVAKPNSSAASVARIGSQRPKMTAARAMKPSAVGHLLVERADRAEREVRAADAGDRARERDVPEPGAVHVDADGVGGLRVLADRAHPQTPAGLEQPEPDQEHRDVHQVHDDRLPEEHRPDDRDLATAPGSAAAGTASVELNCCGVRGQHLRVQEAGQPDDQHVEHDTDDHLVDDVADRERREHERHQHAADHRGDQPEHRPSAVTDADERGREGAEQQLALDRDVDDAGALADHAAERAEDERRARARGRRPADREPGSAASRRPPRPGTRRGTARRTRRSARAAPCRWRHAPSTGAQRRPARPG